METSLNREHETVAECKTINNELNECISNGEMESSKHNLNKIIARNFSQTFNCRLCDGSYDKLVNLKAHMKSDHPCQFNCNNCDLVFTCMFDLEEHLVNIHKERKKFECVTCGTRFVSRWKFDQHTKSHKTEL